MKNSHEEKRRPAKGNPTGRPSKGTKALDLFFGYPTEPVELFVLIVSIVWGGVFVWYPDTVGGLELQNVGYIPVLTWGIAMLCAGLTKAFSLFLPRWSKIRWLSSAFQAAWFMSLPYAFSGVYLDPLLTSISFVIALTSAVDAIRLHTIRRVRQRHGYPTPLSMELGEVRIRAAGGTFLFLSVLTAILHVVSTNAMP